MRSLGPWLLAVCASMPALAFAEAGEGTSVAHQIAEEESAHATHSDPAGHELSFTSLVQSREFQGTVFNFLVLVGLLVWVVRTKVNPMLAARRDEVEKELADAQRLRAEAERRHLETASRLERLDQEMAQIRAEMIKAGEAERDRIVAQAEEKAARMRKDTSFLIDQQIKQLRKDLSEEAANAAIQAAHALLQERTTDADQDQLAEAYLRRLDEVLEERSS